MSTPQLVHALEGEAVRTLQLPSPSAEVLPGVKWGRFDVPFTPAFWASRDWVHRINRTYLSVRLGETVREEVIACLLGGYGVPAEVGLAAFHRLKMAGVLDGTPTSARVASLLSQPLRIGNRKIRYRFAAQRARFVSDILRQLPSQPELPTDDRVLRNRLMALPGIGPKTASWITRNLRGSDQVAILDVHICRACSAAGVFDGSANPQRDYLRLETRFLEFASALGVRASHFDNVIWQTMRRIGSRTSVAVA